MFDYQSLLRQYCGQRIESILDEWGDHHAELGGLKRQAVLISVEMEFLTPEEPARLFAQSAAAYRAIMSNTEAVGIGHFVDVGVGHASGYFGFEEDHWGAYQLISKALTFESNLPAKVGFGLHAGTAVIANVGAPVRHSLALLGPARRVTDSLAKLAIQNGRELVVSGEYAERFLVDAKLHKIGSVEIAGSDISVRALSVGD